MKVETLGNVGAYLSNMASGGPTMSVSYGTGTYEIENFEAVAKVILTNTGPVDAYRGYGRPEAAYIAELRSGPAGHFAYREAAWQIFEALKERFPAFAASASGGRVSNPREEVDLLKR